MMDTRFKFLEQTPTLESTFFQATSCLDSPHTCSWQVLKFHFPSWKLRLTLDCTAIWKKSAMNSNTLVHERRPRSMLVTFLNDQPCSTRSGPQHPLQQLEPLPMLRKKLKKKPSKPENFDGKTSSQTTRDHQLLSRMTRP